MAAVARGCTFRTVIRPIDDRERRTLGVEGVWGAWVLGRVASLRLLAHLDTAQDADQGHHRSPFRLPIMDKRNWTLEQLVAWVETVEPKEVQPEDGPSLVIQRRESRSFELQRLRRRKSGTPSATPSRLGMPHRENGS